MLYLIINPDGLGDRDRLLPNKKLGCDLNNGFG